MEYRKIDKLSYNLHLIKTDKFKTIFYKDFFLPIIHNISNDTFFGGYYYVKIRFCDD